MPTGAMSPREPVRVVEVTRAVRAVIGELVHDGATNPEIAERLSISRDTVKSQVKVALEAVGCTNRTALVCALLHGRVKLHTVTVRAPEFR